MQGYLLFKINNDNIIFIADQMKMVILDKAFTYKK